ncbi:efflux RND transporter periplasmic adaptor subunit [Novosphingobium sp.]|uniref:efflux RND transporter periplasmic adaptor subunit n=1 Tax=Novosphingobium sp. TaxID=1874826 RepID=UPI002FE42465
MLTACGEHAAPPAVQPTVGFVTVKEEAVTLTTELPGRTTAYEISDVRPQVSGIILKRLFREGDMVRAGQALYEIDPAPYRAQAANARAALGKAQASIAAADGLARRYGELVKINAVGKQDYENAVASAGEARAEIAAQRAALQTAEIDLRRTRVSAPISGRIGRSIYTVGALVSASQTNALTTIQRLDPIYVDLTQSSADLIRLRKQLLSGELSRDGSGNATVRLLLEDGSIYDQTGTLQFSDVTVDQTTGSVTLRALFPNPQGLLLPGMYVRAQLVQGRKARAILAPQQAISRDERGNPTAWVVGSNDKAEQRTLTAPRTMGGNWLVTKGLKAGDRLIVEGGQNLRAGASVKPVAWQAQNAGKRN